MQPSGQVNMIPPKSVSVAIGKVEGVKKVVLVIDHADGRELFVVNVRDALQIATSLITIAKRIDQRVELIDLMPSRN